MSTGPILIADDEAANLAAMRQALAGEGYSLVFAKNGREAIAAVGKHAPSLILLDVQMPDMDGHTACRTLKACPETADIPVIFVTSLSDVADEMDGFASGAVDYITKPISPPIVRARVATHLSLVRTQQLERSHRDAISMLGAAGHYNDTDTGEHIWRMAAYSRALAAASGWDEARCQLLELAAPMHDTGKIGIPDAILRKPDMLDADEWVVMRTHTRIGHGILSCSDAPVFRLAAEIALRHHERWDGSGYPDGLAEDAIPESSRIVALADVFDALSVKRPYKEAWPLDRVVQAIQDGAGSHFEPRLVAHFIAILPTILKLQAEWDAHTAAPPAVTTSGKYPS